MKKEAPSKASALFVTTLLSSALIATVVSAQETTTSSMVGEVTDASGGAVPGASVTAVNLGTGAQRRTATSPAGDYSIPNLSPGNYEVRVEKEGFQTATVKSVALGIGAVLRQDFMLNVGSVSQFVEVSAESPLLESQTATLAEPIGQREIQQLPLNGRSLMQLAALSAGVSPRLIQRGTTQYGQRNEYVTVDGGRDSSTNYVIDGVYVRSLRFNNLSVQPNIDTVGEVQVLRNSFSAEYGQGAAVVTAVTKAGTNELHGTAFEFLKNDKLSARNFFDAAKPPLRRNQFGFTAGGPVLRNKLFAFGGYEGLRTREGRTALGAVPTPKQLSGDLSDVSTPIIDPDPRSPTFNQQFANNIIPASRISRFAQVLSPTIPGPNASGQNNFRIGKAFVDDTNNITVRSDAVVSSQHSLFGRYVYYKGTQINPGTFSTIAFPQDGQNVALGETWTITPTLVNDFRASYNRAVHLINPLSLDGKNWVQLIGLRNLAGGTDSLDFGRPSWSIAGFSGQGEGTITQGANENIYSVSDKVSKVFPKHTVAAGIQAQNRRFKHITEVPPRGNLSFTGKFSGNALADYLLGFCSTCTGALGSSVTPYRDNTFAWFVNDIWQVTSRLTVNLGVRYDYISPWKATDNNEGNFDSTAGKIAYHKVPANISPALQPLIINQDNFYPAGIISPDKRDFSPRVGIAYRARGDLVIRSGFGIFYENLNLNELQFTRLVAPFYGIFTIIPDAANPISADTLFPDLSQVTSFPAPFAVDPHNRTPYTEQWNLSVQKMLWQNYLVEVAYEGSQTHKLWKRWNQNQASFGTTPLQTRLPYPAFQAGILTSSNMANANFNALSLRVQRRFFRGLSFLGNYQYSKAIDNNSGEAEANDTANRTNFKLDRGRSRFDQRHRAVFSFGYDLPAGQGKRWLATGGPASYALGGWAIQGIVTLLSGVPFTPTGPGVCDCGSFVPQRVDAVKPGFGKLDNRTANRWFDPTAFARPPQGSQGSAGRNIITGPSLKTFDFALDKNFRIRENLNLQFRSEFFNLLNRANFNFPDGNISNITAGVISSAGNPREVQFGLKLLW